MADVEGFLTRKVGPLPVWAYAAGGGVLLGVIFLYRRGSAASGAPDAQGAPGTGPYAPSPIVVTTGNLPDGTSSGNAAGPPPASSPTMATIKSWMTGTPAWMVSDPKNPGQPLARIPDGTSVVVTGAAVQGKAAGNPQGPQVTAWYPVTWGGLNGYVSAADIGGFTGGMGGGMASSMVKFIPGSHGGKVTRHLSPLAHSQYMDMGGRGGRGGGGGSRGHAALDHVSRRTGLPKIRLMSLNPGFWRNEPGKSDRVVHIH